MASAAEVQSWLNKLGIYLLSATLGFTAAAAIAAGLTVHVMQYTAKNELRAYVQAEDATVIGNGSRKFAIEIVVLNSGGTPCKWFGYRCHPFAGTVSSDDEFPREVFKTRPLKRWNGLANGHSLTFDIRDEDVFKTLNLATTGNMGFRIDGVIEYETFFGEVFETEFSFFQRRVTIQMLNQSLDKEDKVRGFKLSRSTRILNSYRKISG